MSKSIIYNPGGQLSALKIQLFIYISFLVTYIPFIQNAREEIGVENVLAVPVDLRDCSQRLFFHPGESPYGNYSRYCC